MAGKKSNVTSWLALATGCSSFGVQMIPETWLPPQTKGFVSLVAFLFAVAFGIAALSSWMRQSRDKIKYLKGFGAGAFIFGCAGLIFVIHYMNKPPVLLTKSYIAADPNKMELHLKEKFEKTDIVLDGKRFVDCQFIQCTVVWNGDGFIIEQGNYFDRINIKTTSMEAAGILKIFRMLDLFDKKKVGFEGPL